MPSNNERDNTVVYALVFIAAMAAMIAIFIFAVAAFLAFIYTILSLCAWHKPLQLGSLIITPEEARAFVARGLIGGGLAPAFAVFACLLFGGQMITGEALFYITLGGYIAGSLGIECLAAQEAQAAPQEVMPHFVQIPPQRPLHPTPSQPAQQPFRFATWDDEERGS